MDYKKLIGYILRDWRAFILIISLMLISILVGLVIINEISFSSVISLLIIFIICVGYYFYKKFLFNKIFEELLDKEKQNLNADLNTTLFFVGRNYALSSKYIISFVKPKIISYNSILIIDKLSELNPQNSKNSSMCDMVYIFTKNLKFKFITKEYRMFPAKEAYYNHLYSFIKAQNPNVLEGYTKENRKKIQEKYNIKI